MAIISKLLSGGIFGFVIGYFVAIVWDLIAFPLSILSKPSIFNDPQISGFSWILAIFGCIVGGVVGIVIGFINFRDFTGYKDTDKSSTIMGSAATLGAVVPLLLYGYVWVAIILVGLIAFLASYAATSSSESSKNDSEKSSNLGFEPFVVAVVVATIVKYLLPFCTIDWLKSTALLASCFGH